MTSCRKYVCKMSRSHLPVIADEHFVDRCSCSPVYFFLCVHACVCVHVSVCTWYVHVWVRLCIDACASVCV